MISDFYLDAAVRIKRKYLDLTLDLSKYETYLDDTMRLINETLDKVGKISKDVNDPKKRRGMSEADVLNNLQGMMKKLEDDATNLEKRINPVNDQIEKLAVEEKELYSSIRRNYPGLTEREVVDQVSQRLRREGLI